MIEDVEYALNRLSGALADGDPSWIEDAVQEVAIAMDEQRDELLWAVSRVAEARADGDTEWIADTIEDLQNLMLAHGAYTEINNDPITDDDDEDEKADEAPQENLDNAHEYPSGVPPWLRRPDVWT